MVDLVKLEHRINLSESHSGEYEDCPECERRCINALELKNIMKDNILFKVIYTVACRKLCRLLRFSIAVL